tara:strand:+ start:240 stop:1115 length:876 start_codon:yes stop_codon:yes gene_type:complete
VQERSPSRTALSTAFLRAAHLCIDDNPPVLDDKVSLLLLPDYQRRYLSGLGRFANPLLNRLRRPSDAFNAMRSHIVVRARYAEDKLERARRQGIERYVILAAGLDTFAWRQADDEIEVVEIDHPATQAWKRELITRSRLQTPEDVSFLPINFESQTLRDIWPDSEGPDFISWLGTTYYLSSAAINETLSTLAQVTKPGTQLVLDFWGKAKLNESSTPLLLGTRISVALLREPMRSFFDVDEIHALAQATGWSVREVSHPSDQNARYLAQRNDRLKVPSFTYLAHLENIGKS